MKKYLILAIIFALLCALTLVSGLIFLDPVTALITWVPTLLTSLTSFAFFMLYYVTNPQTADENENQQS